MLDHKGIITLINLGSMIPRGAEKTNIGKNCASGEPRALLWTTHPYNLGQAIADFDDATSEKLFEIMKSLLGVELLLSKSHPENEMSQRYVSCGGHNISFTSSGTRLIASILTSLMDTDYKTILIDEPALGINPEGQGILADFLFDKEARKKYFAHVETFFLATHSTVFLDRRRISNNYEVSKSGDTINISQVQTVFEIHGVDARNKAILNKTLRRDAVTQFFADLPPCIVGMEACCGLHYWARVFADLGHEVRLISPQFVTP